MKRYSKHIGFIRNRAIRREIRSLDPKKDHCRIVHLMTGYEFPWDIVRALEVALMKTFCSPRISHLLNRTGEFRKHGQKRYDDTALLVAEFMQNGYDSERGRMAIGHMNRIHGFYAIANEDFLFVLSTFIFLPIQWVDTWGWRKTTPQERESLFLFFREVGRRMNIQDIPGTMEEFKIFVSVYEKENFLPVETNKAVANATVDIVKKWMPSFLRPMVFPVMKCLLDKPMLQALGYTPPPAILQKTVYGAMRMRAFFLQFISFKKYPSFVTIEKNRTYPSGYEIEQLGPDNLVKKWNQ